MAFPRTKVIPAHLELDWDEAELDIHAAPRGVTQQYWWVCRSGTLGGAACGHRWRTTLHQRLYYGTSCPYCQHSTQRRPIPDRLRAEWNEPFPIDTAFYNRSCRWKCAAGHRQKNTITNRLSRGCRLCGHASSAASRRYLAIPDHVRMDWDERIPIDSAPRGRIRFRFVHRASQRGERPCGGSWLALLFSRIKPDNPTGCPHCCNQRRPQAKKLCGS